jgi:hypothetical protein
MLQLSSSSTYPTLSRFHASIASLPFFQQGFPFRSHYHFHTVVQVSECVFIPTVHLFSTLSLFLFLLLSFPPLPGLLWDSSQLRRRSRSSALRSSRRSVQRQKHHHNTSFVYLQCSLLSTSPISPSLSNTPPSFFGKVYTVSPVLPISFFLWYS